MSNRSIRVIARTSGEFSREMEGDIQHVPGHFSSHPQLVSGAHEYDVNQLRSELDLKVDNFNKRGSGFILDNVTDFTLVITQYRPLSGSSYIPTPPSIVKKEAVINIRNSDQFCFQWAILSCLHPSKNHHTNSVYSYTKYRDTLNFQDISFPVKIKDIAKFEKLNPQISVNVISLDPDTKGYCVEYLSPERQRQHHVNLLLLHDANTQHYVWIKNFFRLLSDRTNHKGSSYVCNSCLNVFSSQRVLDSHIPNCLIHSPQQLIYPDPHNVEQFKLKFRDHDKEHPSNFTSCAISKVF